MDAQFHLPQSSADIQESASAGGISFAWLDIAYGILFAPGKTLEILGNASVYKTGNRAVAKAFLAFLLSTVVANFATAVPEPNRQSLAAFFIISTLMSLFTWLSLAVFLQVLCSLFNRPINKLSTLIVTGWAFLPLVFTAPISCFVLASDCFRTFSIIPLAWFIYLQVLAFKSLLKLGKVTTLFLLIVVPPIVFFAFLFWFAALLFIFLGTVLSSIG